MLLVKSKELKNSNKNVVRTACYALFCTFLWSPISLAQSSAPTQSLSNPSSVLSIFLSLLFVVAIIFALAWLMRRFNVTQAGNGQMKVVASMMAGAKEKIMVIEVGEEQFLLGVTPHNINQLAKLEKPISATSKNPVKQNALSANASFQQKLVQAMASSLTGSKATDSSVDTEGNNDTDVSNVRSTKQKQKQD